MFVLMHKVILSYDVHVQRNKMSYASLMCGELATAHTCTCHTSVLEFGCYCIDI